MLNLLQKCLRFQTLWLVQWLAIVLTFLTSTCLRGQFAKRKVYVPFLRAKGNVRWFYWGSFASWSQLSRYLPAFRMKNIFHSGLTQSKTTAWPHLNAKLGDYSKGWLGDVYYIVHKFTQERFLFAALLDLISFLYRFLIDFFLQPNRGEGASSSPPPTPSSWRAWLLYFSSPKILGCATNKSRSISVAVIKTEFFL